MIQDGLTQPLQRQADVRGGDRGRRRARDHPRRHGPLGAALARARGRGDRRRPPARGDRPGDGVVEEGRHHRRGRRGAAPRHLARAARQAAGPELEGGLAHRRQLARRQRRRGRARGRLGGVGAGQRQGGARHDRRPGPGRRRLRLPRPHARQRRQARAREGRPAAGRHRPVGDQRGVRLRHAQLDPDARDRRGPRQRQRRRRRDRPSDRRLGRAHPRHAACTSCAGAAAATAARRSAPAAARATPSSSRCERRARACSHRRPGAARCAVPTSRARPSSTSTAR